MKARYIQKGDSIDYTPTTDVAASDVVRIGSLVGVAKLDIKAGELGALALNGVYELAKASGATFNAGEAVYFDPATGNACASSVAGSFKFGYAIANSNASVFLVCVKLT